MRAALRSTTCRVPAFEGCMRHAFCLGTPKSHAAEIVPRPGLTWHAFFTGGAAPCIQYSVLRCVRHCPWACRLHMYALHDSSACTTNLNPHCVWNAVTPVDRDERNRQAACLRSSSSPLLGLPSHLHSMPPKTRRLKPELRWAFLAAAVVFAIWGTYSLSHPGRKSSTALGSAVKLGQQQASSDGGDGSGSSGVARKLGAGEQGSATSLQAQPCPTQSPSKEVVKEVVKAQDPPKDNPRAYHLVTTTQGFANHWQVGAQRGAGSSAFRSNCTHGWDAISGSYDADLCVRATRVKHAASHNG